MQMLVGRFINDENGATAIEYGLIAGLVFLVVVGALSSTGGGVMSHWQDVMERVGSAMGNGGDTDSGSGGSDGG